MRAAGLEPENDCVGEDQPYVCLCLSLTIKYILFIDIQNKRCKTRTTLQQEGFAALEVQFFKAKSGGI
jgi:hypothetical protein